MTKKYIILVLLCILFCTPLLACAQGAPEIERNIVGQIGIGEGDLLYNTNTLEGAVECADLIIVGTVAKIVDITYDEHDDPKFTYEIVPSDVFYDRNGRIDNSSKNAPLLLSIRHCGYISAKEYQAEIKENFRADKFGIAKGEYTDNDYVAFYEMGGLIFEEGKSYILFLNDENYEKDKDFSLATYTQNFEVNGSKLTALSTETTSPPTLKQFKKDLSAAIEKRTGELDNGLDAYLNSKK